MSRSKPRERSVGAEALIGLVIDFDRIAIGNLLSVTGNQVPSSRFGITRLGHPEVVTALTALPNDEPRKAHQQAKQESDDDEHPRIRTRLTRDRCLQTEAQQEYQWNEECGMHPPQEVQLPTSVVDCPLKVIGVWSRFRRHPS